MGAKLEQIILILSIAVIIAVIAPRLVELSSRSVVDFLLTCIFMGIVAKVVKVAIDFHYANVHDAKIRELVRMHSVPKRKET